MASPNGRNSIAQRRYVFSVLKEISDNLPLKALKGRNSIAQGIALGKRANSLFCYQEVKTMHIHAKKPIQPQTNNSSIVKESFAQEPSLFSSSSFAHDFSRIPVRNQTKPMRSQSEEVFEQQTKRLSKQVIHKSEPQLRRACACGATCHMCETKQPTSEHQRLQDSNTEQITEQHLAHKVLAASGQSMDTATRGFMESRFGYDFSRVKLHTGAMAAESAQAVNARAYTVGQNIVFAAGQFAPSTNAGRSLLAHELTHVMQQREVGNAGRALTISHPDDATEQQADQIAREVVASAPGNKVYAAGTSNVNSVINGVHHTSAPMLQREPTRPRGVTGKASLDDLTTQTATATGTVTAGSLARMEWESLFSRHFTERDRIENKVESRHARYLYSTIYGWIDAQHFFAHIQFAEEKGLQGATDKGLDIESKQEIVRSLVGPDPFDTSIYSDFLQHDLIDASDFIHYREEVFMALAAAMNFLSDQEKALIQGFDDEKLAKVMLDNAKSAWSYEDLVSNQLGVQFFRLYGAYVNAGTDASEVRQRFIEKMTEFFATIRIVDNKKKIDSLRAKLPGKERWKSPKMTEAQAKAKYPELFDFGSSTHRLLVSVHNQQADAETRITDVARVAPSVPRPHVEAQGAQFAVYTDPVSHFEAVVMRVLLSKGLSVKLNTIVVEPVASGTTTGP
jgi:hypothetical protein